MNSWSADPPDKATRAMIRMVMKTTFTTAHGMGTWMDPSWYAAEWSLVALSEERK